MSKQSEFVEGPGGLKIEYRYDVTGVLDEVVMYQHDECIFHLEHMGGKGWYAGLYLPGTEKNRHGVTPAIHSLQMWFSSLSASNDRGDIALPED